MRSDMKKVVCERPRARGVYCYGDMRRRQNGGDVDDLPYAQGMRKPYGYNSKNFTDLLGPLRGFFEHSVGRVYNDVWSELCANLKGGSTTEQHVISHARDMVETNTIIIKGKVYVSNAYGIMAPRDLYVDPNDGIIHRMPPRVQPKRVDDGLIYTHSEYEYIDGRPKLIAPRVPVRKIFANGEEAAKVAGLWYWVIFAVVPPPSVNCYWIGDVKHESLIHHRGIDWLTGAEVSKGRYRDGKRQMNSRDLRRHGLVNG